MCFMGVCRLLRRLVGSCNAEPVRGGSLTGSAAEELDGVCAGAVDDLAAFITFKMMSILACLGDCSVACRLCRYVSFVPPFLVYSILFDYSIRMYYNIIYYTLYIIIFLYQFAS